MNLMKIRRKGILNKENPTYYSIETECSNSSKSTDKDIPEIANSTYKSSKEN